MARTFRRRPTKLRKAERWLVSPDKVRDGTPTHSSKSCENNGSCPWCLRNRMHKHLKKLIDIKDDLL